MHHAAQPHSAWLQLLRLSVSAIRPAAQRTFRHLLDLGYAAYFWTLFAPLAVLIYLLVLLPLRASIRWSMAHRTARAFIHLAGIPFTVTGSEHLRSPDPRIVVANHSSYLDGLFLLATLPHSSRFVAKQELERMPLVGTFLHRLNAEFVERFDTRTAAEDAQHLASIARQGYSLVFFPEGTFTRAPGLMPFHLGAFETAVQSGLPVLPVAMRGMRSLLRDQQWLPRRVAIVASIGSPIAAPPVSEVFAATVQLRDAARRAILANCGESDLLDVG